MKRVVITGRGVQSPIGRGVPAFLQGLQAGTVGIGAVEGLATRTGAVIAGFDPMTEFTTAERAVLDRSAQLAVLSAREAIAECGVPADQPLGARTAVIMGVCSGSIATLEESYRKILVDKRRLSPFTVPKIMSNSSAAQISMRYGITGPAFAVSSACSSAAYAISLGLHLIRSGAVDRAIVGGAEASLFEGNVSGWDAMRVLSPDLCRPFSKGRLGLVLGEAAGTLVIESLDHARSRGAPLFGELLACAVNSDAAHLLAPSETGQAAAIRACMQDAQIDAGQLCYVNAHGTGTAANDVTETRALRLALGDAADRLQVSSTKSMHGHALGAGGAIEAIATQLALQERFAPPTMNFTERDPDCDLNYVPNEAQELRRRPCALSNSFAFGGHNAVLAMRAAAHV